MKKRLLAAVLALCLLAGLPPCTALAAQPEAAEILEEIPPVPGPYDAASQTDYAIRSLILEADQSAAKVSVKAGTDCFLWVGLYGEDGQFLGAGTQPAKAGTRTISVTLPAKAPEDFTAKAFLLDENEAPLCGSYRTGTYSIDGLRLEDGKIRAGVTTTEACTLRVRFRSEDGKKTLKTVNIPAAGVWNRNRWRRTPPRVCPSIS